MAEKTEKATPRKLRDARKKGQVSKSQDFPSAFTFAVSIFCLLGFSGYLYQQLAEFMISTFRLIPKFEIKSLIGPLMTGVFQVTINASMPILGVVTAVGVLVNFLLIGPMFSLQAIKPDIKKLNPIQGIKQKFKWKTVFELVKSILKIGVATYLIYTVIWDSLDVVTQTVAFPVVSSAYIVADFLKRVVIKVGIFFLFVAILDLAYQKHTFAKEMKMEKFEVKQEFKDTEGDPQIKGRRKQLAQEIAYEEGPAVARRAKAVITNPTHIAVAIGYEPDKYPAPYILTMGISNLAETIIRIAEKHGVPIMRDVELAHMLYDRGAINRYIPEETYEAVAEILRFVILMENKEYE